MPQTKRLLSILVSHRSDTEDNGWLVYRTGVAIGGGSPWEDRILQLGDGRRVCEIARLLYQEQLDRGAALVDIGIWKSLFDLSVVESIGGLVRSGHLRVESTVHPGRRSDASTTVKRTRARRKDRIAVSNKKDDMTRGSQHRSAGKTKPQPEEPRKWANNPQGAATQSPPESQGSAEEVLTEPGPAQQAFPHLRSLAAGLRALVTGPARRGLGAAFGHSNNATGSGGR